MWLAIYHILVRIKPSAFEEKHLVTLHMIPLILTANPLGRAANLFNCRIHLSLEDCVSLGAGGCKHCAQ